MKLSAAISEAFLIFPRRDRPVCHAVQCCLVCAGWTLPCHSSLQSASEFQCNHSEFAPRYKWKQHPSAGKSKQRFGEYLLACEGSDTRQVCQPHLVPGLLHLLPRVELLLHPYKQAATNAHDHSCYLLWLLTAASSIPSKLRWSPMGELRHPVFGKEPHSHESKHSFYTAI